MKQKYNVISPTLHVVTRLQSKRFHKTQNIERHLKIDHMLIESTNYLFFNVISNRATAGF